MFASRMFVSNFHAIFTNAIFVQWDLEKAQRKVIEDAKAAEKAQAERELLEWSQRGLDDPPHQADAIDSDVDYVLDRNARGQPSASSSAPSAAAAPTLATKELASAIPVPAQGNGEGHHLHAIARPRHAGGAAGAHLPGTGGGKRGGWNVADLAPPECRGKLRTRAFIAPP